MADLVLERTEAAPNERQREAAGLGFRRRRRIRLATVARGASGILLLAALWQVLPDVHAVNSYFIPPLNRVLSSWWALVKNGTMLTEFRASVIRCLVGFAIALLVAIPLGAAIAWYRIIRETVTPVLEIFRNTAALALLPVFVLLLGIGETSEIAIVIYACVFPILLNTISGVSNVDPQLLRQARVLGFSPIATFRKVVFPAALPTIFTGIRIAGAASVLVLIASELVGATAGLGFYINYAENNFLIPQMYAVIITTSLLGLAINYGLVGIERYFSRWRA